MKSIELFAGAGGLGIGMSNAGFSPAMVVEWDRWCCDTIRENQSRLVNPVRHWPAPIERDVRNVEFSNLEGKIELVSGGPPCQPFSLGGRHRAHDDARDMWPEVVRVVRDVKPKAFVFENVKGLTRSSFASYLAYIVQQLSHPDLVRKNDESWLDHLGRLERCHTGEREPRGLGYNVVFRVLNAADYGIPQRRERVVFVGFRTDLGVNWSFPEQTHSRAALLREKSQRGKYWDRHAVSRKERNAAQGGLTTQQILLEHLKPWRTIRDVIADLPDPQLMPEAAAAFPNHRFQGGARVYPGHTGSPLDEPSKTLKAGVHGVPGGENMLRRPDGSVRYFTVREAARLQTFPDNYLFHGSWTETMRQLGNAVPVDLAKIVAEDVRKNLEKVATGQ